ncbi:MAG: two-component system OmpR family phosphate regulon sensor histidine kinase PhoR [Candidatus Saganbacteria bacterium]|uniref:histidine kinase n=1 Tax=Candidatus Saganbacteria bacterium TaxID=2575572 RepID=A0A833KZV4_UNCSA|nr:MAG: two-component system OmpR family phosphate regulon sensor histidine kinase PhoR [Candidatus Saganbacteria bacterium]
MFKFPFTIISTSKYEEIKMALRAFDEKAKEISALLEAQRGIAGVVLGGMAEGVLAVDQLGRIIIANPAIEKMFGIIEPEIIGKTIREGIRNNEIAELIEESRKSGTSIYKEINIITPFQADFAATACPIRSHEKEIIGVVCVLHDISELKKLERYRTEFVANASHELKTPLTAIRSYVETLLDGAINDKGHNVEFLTKIEKHSINLSALIDDLLEISKLEARKELGVFARFDINQNIKRSVEMISVKARKKGVALINQCRDKEVFINGIDDHISRAITNLLDNAVNYTDPGGEVSINCVRFVDRIEVSVSDTGIGIPQEHLPRIFERFYRVDKARSRDLGGTGLGLAIVKHVANVHNGTVSVKSEEGKGSVFSVILPAA